MVMAQQRLAASIARLLLLQRQPLPAQPSLGWAVQCGCCRLQQQPESLHVPGFPRSYARQPDSQQTWHAPPRQRLQRPQDQQQRQQQRQQAPWWDGTRPYPKRSSGQVQPIYRGRWILPVRLFVRSKVFQLLGGGSIALLLASMTMQEASSEDVLGLAALAVGMVASSCCLWYYSRRYVGEASLLLPERRYVRLSVLDFWGNREDNDVPLSALTPPLKDLPPHAAARLTSRPLFPLTVQGDRQYYLNSLHDAKLLDGAAFMALLKGEPLPPLPGQPGSSDCSGGADAPPGP